MTNNNNENDVAAIYDLIRSRLNTTTVEFSVVTREKQKLAKRYSQHISQRNESLKDDNDEYESEKHIEYGSSPVVGQYDVGNISIEPAFLLVYAAAGDGQIIRIGTLGTPTQVVVSGKEFMAEMSQRESARWVEALDMLISWGWVKAVGRKGEIFQLTGTGYKKADWLKKTMDINTDNEPLEELKEFEQ